MSQKEPVHYLPFLRLNDPIQASLVTDRLAQEEIPYKTFGHLTGAALGAGESVAYQRIEVASTHMTQAQAILRELTLDHENLVDDEELTRQALASSHSSKEPTSEDWPTLLPYSHEVARIAPFSLALLGGLLGLLFLAHLIFLSMQFERSLLEWDKLLVSTGFFFGGGMFIGAVIGALYNLLQPIFGGIRYQARNLHQLPFAEAQSPLEAFYLDQAHQIQGPFSLQELRQHANDGQIGQTTLIQVGNHAALAHQVEWIASELNKKS